ncbi:MAG TPA: GDSL-type esterase/lipase family protein [Rhodanobacteraceae bacterium]
MTHPMPLQQRLGLILLATILLLPCPLLHAAPPQARKWVATWAQPMTPDYTRPNASYKTPGAQPAGKLALVPPPVATNITLRQTVLTSIGGDRVRIRLSNYDGSAPMVVTGAHVALGAAQSNNLAAIDAASDRALTFHGHPSVTIAPGQVVTSDPVALRVPRLSHLTVSLYFAGRTTFNDVHPLEFGATTAVVAGNAMSAATFADDKRLGVLGGKRPHRLFVLTGVDVLAPRTTRVIAAFGDSITDGAYATTLAHPWPQQLSAIANRQPGQPPVAVINEGLSSNELTVDQPGFPLAGMSGLKRFERDVIDQPGITDVAVLFGTNDINRGSNNAGLPKGATSGDIIAGLRMLADVAHAHHLRIYVGTITPFAGFTLAGWYTPAKEAVRRRVNHWITHTHAIDGVIPFAKALAGPYKPTPLAAAQSPLPPGLATICAGDAGLHPNDRGYTVMGTLAYDVMFHAHVKAATACH